MVNSVAINTEDALVITRLSLGGQEHGRTIPFADIAPRSPVGKSLRRNEILLAAPKGIIGTFDQIISIERVAAVVAVERVRVCTAFVRFSMLAQV
jgi:hypothetical protein